MYSVSRLSAEKQTRKPVDSNGMSFDGKSGSVLPDCEVEVEQEAMVDEEKKKSKITLKLEMLVRKRDSTA